MSKRKKKDKQLEHDERVDIQICKLADKLRKQGLENEELIIAVARIYGNSVLLTYKQSFN